MLTFQTGFVGVQLLVTCHTPSLIIFLQLLQYCKYMSFLCKNLSFVWICVIFFHIILELRDIKAPLDTSCGNSIFYDKTQQI